ncbi:hypothetical protein G7043_31285 [Lentzea sp. NEAU-D13]|uniref:Uncharacterized protein n=1 Tax=Lentzea alba TaxID=2714351 RepID=A0A7C9VXK3_9PSEU|nr:hypothetical protein [Lentzea alba]NGY63416.1 hypothetical protein [Lentzea alba]
MRIVRCVAFAVIAVGEFVLVLGPWFLAALRWFTGKDADWWGAAGQWAGALGSVAAVVAALWIAKKGARDAAQIAEQGAREAAAREQRRQRAAAMLVHGEYPSSEARDLVSIVNDSQFPVVNVQVVAVKGGDLAPLVPPSGSWPIHAVLMPGEQVGTRPMFGKASDGNFYGLVISPQYSIVIEFTDIEGYRWRREGEGLPEHLA